MLNVKRGKKKTRNHSWLSLENVNSMNFFFACALPLPNACPSVFQSPYVGKSKFTWKHVTQWSVLPTAVRNTSFLFYRCKCSIILFNFCRMSSLGRTVRFPFFLLVFTDHWNYEIWPLCTVISTMIMIPFFLSHRTWLFQVNMTIYWNSNTYKWLSVKD